MSATAQKIIAFGTPAAYQGRVLVRETASGAWVVRDDANSRGGRFTDRRAAMRFVAREFGHGANVIEGARPATPTARRLGSADIIRLRRTTGMAA